MTLPRNAAHWLRLDPLIFVLRFNYREISSLPKKKPARGGLKSIKNWMEEENFEFSNTTADLRATNS
jgi:hypothetical protein